MIDEALLEKYLSTGEKGRTAIMTCAEILEGRGITSPTESDIQGLKTELLARGKNPHTAANWVSLYRKFLRWVNSHSQEGEAEQMSLGFETNNAWQERESLQNEPETPAVMENTSTEEEEKATAFLELSEIEPQHIHEPVEGQHAPITEAEAESEAIDEPETPAQPRRGRKPKDEQERRSVKLSIYLTPKLYEGLKILASIKREDISDMVFSQLENFVERNSENVKKARNFFASLGVIK